MLGEDDPATLALVNNLALDLRVLGEFRGARMYRELGPGGTPAGAG